jgi:hypothetical protein
LCLARRYLRGKRQANQTLRCPSDRDPRPRVVITASSQQRYLPDTLHRRADSILRLAMIQLSRIPGSGYREARSSRRFH